MEKQRAILESVIKEEIDFMITDYVAGKIPDYQKKLILFHM